VAARTGTGARPSQQDAVLTGTRVHAVADGFGHDGGLAAGALAELAALDAATGLVDPLRLLDDAVGAAAAAVAARGRSGSGDDRSGCTLTALVLGDTDAALAHVGDSRAYLLRDGRLARLTRDHTDVQSLLDEGRLTEDEARSHSRRAELNRALVPGGSAAPDISLHATRPGDRFVLTTDGVHATLQPGELASLVKAGGTPDEVVSLVEDAVLAAGSPDNYSVVAVDLPVADR
jgi:protein phosphatase